MKLLTVIFFFCASAYSEATVLSYKSELAISPDQVLATDLIQVSSDGETFSKGIGRIFPRIKFWSDDTLLKYKLKYAKKDESNISHKVMGIDEKKTLLLFPEQENQKLSAGNHKYEFQYQVSPLIDNLKDGYSRIYWDCTGTSWNVSIQSANCRAIFPKQFDPKLFKLIGYVITKDGDQLRDQVQAKIYPGQPMIVDFTAKRVLKAEEGLAIDIRWPTEIFQSNKGSTTSK